MHIQEKIFPQSNRSLKKKELILKNAKLLKTNTKI